MKLVVSDASVLRALSQLRLLRVFDTGIETVLVPPAVIAELAAGRPHLVPFNVADVRTAEIAAPLDEALVGMLVAKRMGLGESQAIALAIERSADALLVDDALARQEASRRGLRVVGTLALLVRAKQHGVVVSVAPLIEALQAELSFRLSISLIDSVLRSVGESRGTGGRPAKP